MSGKAMKVFVIGSCMIAAYLFRLYQFPKGDEILANLESNPPPAFKARIVDEPDSSMYGLRARAKVLATCDSAIVAGSVEPVCRGIDSDTFVQILYSRSKGSGEAEVEVGDIVWLTGSIRKMTFINDDPKEGGKSLETFFKRQKIFYEIKSAKISHIEKARSLKRPLVRFRKSIEQSIADALPRPHSDLAQGLVVSGKGSMTKDLLEKFKRVGLIHIVVLSGSNVSIIAAALMSALRFLPRFICGVVGLFGMSLFAVMTGAAPPVVRSVLMSSIPLVIPLIYSPRRGSIDIIVDSGDPDKPNHKPDAVRAQLTGIQLLCLTGYIMCLFNPLFLLYDISFQLSFMATLGLVLYAEPISKRLAFIPSKFGLREIIASSLGTQILVMPLLLEIGGSMSTVFLFANILVLPILPIAMFCIFVTSLSSFIFPAALDAASYVSWLFLEWILRITDIFSGLPFASVHLIDLEKKGVLIYYATVFAASGLLFHRAKKREAKSGNQKNDPGIQSPATAKSSSETNNAPT